MHASKTFIVKIDGSADVEDNAAVLTVTAAKIVVGSKRIIAFASDGTTIFSADLMNHSTAREVGS
jgi:hypothetical protein